MSNKNNDIWNEMMYENRGKYIGSVGDGVRFTLNKWFRYHITLVDYQNKFRFYADEHNKFIDESFIGG